MSNTSFTITDGATIHDFSDKDSCIIIPTVSDSLDIEPKDCFIGKAEIPFGDTAFDDLCGERKESHEINASLQNDCLLLVEAVLYDNIDMTEAIEVVPMGILDNHEQAVSFIGDWVANNYFDITAERNHTFTYNEEKENRIEQKDTIMFYCYGNRHNEGQNFYCKFAYIALEMGEPITAIFRDDVVSHNDIANLKFFNFTNHEICDILRIARE